MKKRTFYVQSKIFEVGLEKCELCVYFYLCNCADKDGFCFPGKKKIGKATGISLTSIQRAIKGLKNKKVIDYTTQFRETGNGNRRQTTNKYKILNLGEDEK